MNIDYKNSIKRRVSTRTFTGEKLTTTEKQKILEYMSNEENLIGINGNKIRFDLRENDGSKSGKIGTYGFIKDAPAFIITICKNDKDSMLDCGYVFEKLVLFLENMNLGTCWLGGTFNRKQLSLETKFEKGDFIPIISPVGKSGKKRSLLEKAIRKTAKSDNRIDFDKLFFSGDCNSMITDEKTRELLELVRLAPSASNKQPWRVVVDSDMNAHFYIERTPSYSPERFGYDIQWLDIGIALAHYELASGKNNFYMVESTIDAPSNKYEYVISVKA